MDKGFLRLAFAGDICLGFLRRPESNVAEFPGWAQIREAVGRYDFLVANLECCLVDDRCSEPARAQGMAVAAGKASLLRDAGFSELCLANNHMLDCGGEAITVTRECLSSLGIRAFGAGENLSQAEQTIISERHGRKVAFIGACDSVRYYASERRAGIAPLKKSRLGRRVREAAERADLVVVTLHADLEFSDVPGAWRQRLSRWLIDQGAHLVIQHHPHVLQGVEAYRGGLIAYSLGNFIFRLRGNRYQEKKPGVFDSLVLVVDVDFHSANPKISHDILPLRIANDHFPRLITDSQADLAIGNVTRLSDLVIDRRARRRAWLQRCQREGLSRMRRIYYTLARRQLARAVREAWSLVANGEDRRWVVGLLSLGYL